MQTKVRKIGNGYGVLLPKKAMEALQLKEGSALTILKKDDGLLLSAYDADFESQMEAFRRVTHGHRNALRELAK